MKILETEYSEFDGLRWLDRIVFEHDGRVFTCTSMSVGRETQAHWHYETGGQEYVAGKAGPDDTPEEVMEEVVFHCTWRRPAEESGRR